MPSSRTLRISLLLNLLVDYQLFGPGVVVVEGFPFQQRQVVTRNRNTVNDVIQSSSSSCPSHGGNVFCNSVDNKDKKIRHEGALVMNMIPSSLLEHSRISSLILQSFATDSIATTNNSETNNDDNDDDGGNSNKSEVSFTSLESLNLELKMLARDDNDNHKNDRKNSTRMNMDVETTTAFARDATTRAIKAQSLVEQCNDSIQPDACSYNYVLLAWNRVVSALLLSPMVSNVIMDNDDGGDDMSMNARKAALHSEELLLSMTTSSSSIASPNTKSYNLVMDSYLKLLQAKKSSQNKGAHKRIEELYRNINPNPPNDETFRIAIEAACSSNLPERAEDIFAEMEQLYNTNKDNIEWTPSIAMYKPILKSWKNRSSNKYQTNSDENAANKCENVLRQMIQLSNSDGDNLSTMKPDPHSYAIVIEAYRKSGMKDCAEQAQRLLFEMKDDANLMPNVKTYTSVIQAWSLAARYNDDAPLAAERLLRQMEDLSNKLDEDYVTMKPNVFTYTAVINAWARSSQDDMKAQKAVQLLKAMKVQQQAQTSKEGIANIRPNLYTYNAVINAAATCKSASSERQQNALKIAFAVFKSLEQDYRAYQKEHNIDAEDDAAVDENGDKIVRANHVTYGTLLKAAYTLMPPADERDDVIKAIFQKCIKDGQVDDGVVNQFRLAASESLIQEMMGDYKNDLDSMPIEWKRNVDETPPR